MLINMPFIKFTYNGTKTWRIVLTNIQSAYIIVRPKHDFTAIQHAMLQVYHFIRWSHASMNLKEFMKRLVSGTKAQCESSFNCTLEILFLSYLLT